MYCRSYSNGIAIYRQLRHLPTEGISTTPHYRVKAVEEDWMMLQVLLNRPPPNHCRLPSVPLLTGASGAVGWTIVRGGAGRLRIIKAAPILDDADEHAPLGGDADAAGRQLLHQGGSGDAGVGLGSSQLRLSRNNGAD